MSERNSIEETYYQKNKDVILNRAKDYYENDKESLREQEINTEIYLKKKKIKRENMENRYHNMCEENKQRLKECQKNYREAKKSQFSNIYTL